MKKVLTLREKAILNNGFFGATWIVIGIIQTIQRNIILDITAAIFLLVGSMSMFIPYFIKTEQEDEMSKYNKNRAELSVYKILALGISVFTLISVFKGIWMIDVRVIMPFVLGGINLAEFIFFIVYEKVGA